MRNFHIAYKLCEIYENASRKLKGEKKWSRKKVRRLTFSRKVRRLDF